MKKTVSLLLALLLIATTLLLASCEEPDGREGEFKEDWESKHAAQTTVEEETEEEETTVEETTAEPVDFIKTICGTYLVSGKGVLTGGALYDDEGPETTFHNLALHVSEAGKNTVEIDVEGDHAGSGAVSEDSPTVSYKDSMGYEVTATFSVKDGVAHVEMKIFGDLSIEDTGERCTETVTLSGDK